MDKRILTPEIIVNTLKMFPIETQRDLMFGRGFFGIPPVVMVPDSNGERKMLPLDTEENMKIGCELRYQGMLERDITLGYAFYFISKPNRLQMFDFISHIYEIPEPEYTEILKGIWISTEFPHQHPIPKLVALFKRAQSDLLMDEDEKSIYTNLPEVVEVYRGLPDKKAKERGLSWTTDLQKAKWFAKRFNGKECKVLKANINKKHIFLYTDARNERECIVNPVGLKNVKVIAI
jgi:hypothetical protein